MRLLLLLWRWILRLLGLEAVRLNLRIDCEHCGEAQYCEAFKGYLMAKIGDSFTARIAPTNAAGNPAQVFEVRYSEAGDCYDFTVAPDGLTAVFTAVAAGAGNSVSVTAITKGGATLSESLELPDVETPADEEAVALNLSLA